MSGGSTITLMTWVFSITTIAVFLYPVVKLVPSWLEGALNRKIAFHRAAVDAIAAAMAVAQIDQPQRDRLAAQHAYHRRALMAIAPDEPVQSQIREDMNAAA